MENNEMETNEQNSSVDNVTSQNSVNVVESVPNNTIQNNFTDNSLGQNGSGQNNKSNKGLIILVIILSVLIVGLVGFVVYDKVLNKDKNEDEIVTDDSDYNSKNKKDDDSKDKDDNKKDKDDDNKDKNKDDNKKDNASSYLVCTQSASGVDITFNIEFKNNSIQSMDFSYDMSLEEYTSEQISLIEQQDFCDVVKKSMSEYSGAFSDCQQNTDNKHLVVSSTFDISKLNENILNSMVTIEDAKTELEKADYICTIK